MTSLIANYLKFINKTIEKRDNMTLRKIINMLFDFRKRINNIKFYLESNCNKFFDQIHHQIINSDILLKKKYYEYLNDSFKYLDKFFNQDFSKKKNIKTEELKQLKNKIEDNINEAFSKYDFKGLFEKT